MKCIQEKLLEAQSRQKEYADRKVKDLDFMEGKQVFLNVSPIKGVMRFGKRGKLSPRYIGPFEVLTRGGGVLRIGIASRTLRSAPGISCVYAEKIPWGWKLHYSLGFSSP